MKEKGIYSACNGNLYWNGYRYFWIGMGGPTYDYVYF